MFQASLALIAIAATRTIKKAKQTMIGLNFKIKTRRKNVGRNTLKHP